MKIDELDQSQLLSALQERVKELSCLYQISDIAHQPDLDLHEVLSRVISIIPGAMQYPDICSAKLNIDDKVYSTKTIPEDTLSISADIILNYTYRGSISVFYELDDKAAFIPDFLPEEYRLMDAIAKQIALIMERKSVEENNALLQDQLRHADRLATIGQLAAGIAHEINEPLATIMGFAQLIDESTEINEQVRSDVRRIISSTMHAREIIRKLMLFSRQVPPKKVTVDLNKLISEGIYFLESRCERQGITLIRDLDPNLPSLIADPNQIHQIMINLSVNAMQAMPNGGILTLKTRCLNGQIEFSVSDTGIGMSKETLSKIFIPFYTTKDIDQGTGLGLSVVHGIVTSHNGTITVTSEQGVGTTFTVNIGANDA